MSEKKAPVAHTSEDNAQTPESLQKELQEAQKKAADYYDQLLRLKAEFENYRKRVEREKSDARAWGKQDLLMPLLSMGDVFEQALAHAQSATEMAVIVQGIEFLYKNFQSMLRSEGVEAMELVGKPFDPHLAEAVEQQEVDAEWAGKVLSEIQKGYMFQSRVLRPARVRVGVAPAAGNSEPSADGTISDSEQQKTDH